MSACEYDEIEAKYEAKRVAEQIKIKEFLARSKAKADSDKIKEIIKNTHNCVLEMSDDDDN